MAKDKDIQEEKFLDVKPIEKLVLIDHIIETIGKLIASGKLKPGDLVPSERTLSGLLKVSRNSVRQALKALDVLGVLDINPGSRTYLNTSISNLLVNPMKFMTLLHDLKTKELFQTRKIIEVELTKLAAINASEENLAEMAEFLNSAKSHIKSKNKYLEYEMGFHESIFKASGNRVLTALMSSINNLLLESRKKTVKFFPDLSLSLKQHDEIYLSIKDNNPEKAGQLMLEHLNSIEHMMEDD
jgi:GntR family transcriptional regulator, transcriptional repressor for pyruvate dehydrogenase complex